jgi:tRNA nucleotidyltransferase (CCA-adding enzyme)
MCYNAPDGLIDIFGGVEDINNKILRAVGNAETRFTEDALRILRLFRFAATLDFKIEKATFDAAIKCSPLLKNISAERIFTELQKTAMGNNVSVITPLLKTNCLSNYYITNGNLANIENLENNEFLRAFSLFYLTSTDLPKTLDTLKCSNNFKDYCTKMAHLIKSGLPNDKSEIKHALNYADFVIVLDSLKYFEHILNIDVSKQKNYLHEIKFHNEPYKISQLKITGKDIMNSGFDGKDVGEKLSFLLDQVMENPSLNEREKLLKLICN